MSEQVAARTRRAIARALTVNEAIRMFPSTVGVFNAFGIDSCCGGAVSIEEAAERDGADVEALIEALTEAVRGER